MFTSSKDEIKTSWSSRETPSGDGVKSETYLIANDIPEGKIVHTGIIGRVRKEIDGILAGKLHNPIYVPGEEVGLEWRDSLSGEKIPESDKWSAESFVLISDKSHETE